MSIVFLAEVYLDTNDTQYEARVMLDDDLNPVFKVFPDLLIARNTKIDWSLGVKRVAVKFNGTPMNYFTTVSYYPDAGKYLRLNIDGHNGNALHNYAERCHKKGGPRIAFDTTYHPPTTIGGIGTINLTLRK